TSSFQGLSAIGLSSSDAPSFEASSSPLPVSQMSCPSPVLAPHAPNKPAEMLPSAVAIVSFERALMTVAQVYDRRRPDPSRGLPFPGSRGGRALAQHPR